MSGATRLQVSLDALLTTTYISEFGGVCIICYCLIISKTAYRFLLAITYGL